MPTGEGEGGRHPRTLLRRARRLPRPLGLPRLRQLHPRASNARLTRRAWPSRHAASMWRAIPYPQKPEGSATPSDLLLRPRGVLPVSGVPPCRGLTDCRPHPRRPASPDPRSHPGFPTQGFPHPTALAAPATLRQALVSLLEPFISCCVPLGRCRPCLMPGAGGAPFVSWLVGISASLYVHVPWSHAGLPPLVSFPLLPPERGCLHPYMCRSRCLTAARRG